MGLKQWVPYSREEFVCDYVKGLTNDELARKYSGSTDQVKRYIKYLREQYDLPDRKSLSDVDTSKFRDESDSIRKDFLEFLSKARTWSQISNRYGEDLAESLINSRFPGKILFEQIDDYGVRRYILLDEPTKKIQVKKRVWDYHNSFIEDQYSNIKQSYHLVKLPDELIQEYGHIDIIPIFDVHYGHYGHKYEKFMEYIKYVENNDNVFTFIGGDLMENALDDGRGLSYEQTLAPGTQINRIVDLLSTIAHKCIFIMPGNHEWRTYKKAGVDPSFIISSLLEIPHFDGPVYCSILCNGHKWKMYAFHGRGSGMTKGGRINSASRPRMYTDFVNWFVSGHVHDPVLTNDTCLVEDPINCRIDYKPQWTVICPSFLRYEGTYAYREGYPPPGKGGVKLSIYADGHYEARLIDY